jgi:hypothetical protein
MIVRIMTDNQYRIADGDAADLGRLDNALLEAIEADDAQRFRNTLDQLVGFVQGRGTLVPADELVPSDVMVPAPDMTLAEARGVLQHPAAQEPAGGSSGGASGGTGAGGASGG